MDNSKTEEVLKESEEKYRALISASSIMIYSMSPDWSVMYQLHGNGYLANTEEANSNWLNEYIPPDDQPMVTSRIELSVKSKSTFELEHRIICADGSIGWIRSNAIPIKNADGGIVEWFGYGSDITKRRDADTVLKESEQSAYAHVAELVIADKNKNDFIGVLSHELRNPLAIIAVGISILEVSDNKQQIEKVKGIMKRQINQLCKLVDDLMDLTRINENKIELKKENINLNDLVTNAVKDITPEFEKKGLQLISKIQANPIFLNADPVRITQSIGNLLFNATKFTPQGGTVWLSLKREKNEAVIRVKDNGIGISREVLSHLFTPFTQADGSLDRHNNGGLGLGLSIVKGIVGLHKGKVTATSAGLGKGALFTMRLPITIENTGTENSTDIKITGHAYRILIIEDNKDLSEMLCSMLDMLGHVAFPAYGSEEGLAKAREIRPDVVFCDIGLPGKNGYEVAKAIKEDDQLKSIYLIALTGYAGENDIARSMKSGFDRHLAKPVDMAAIESILKEIT